MLLLFSGSSGCFAYELTRVYNNMHVTVFDLPHTVQIARKLQPEETKSRVNFVAGTYYFISFHMFRIGLKGRMRLF